MFVLVSAIIFSSLLAESPASMAGSGEGTMLRMDKVLLGSEVSLRICCGPKYEKLSFTDNPHYSEDFFSHVLNKGGVVRVKLRKGLCTEPLSQSCVGW